MKAASENLVDISHENTEMFRILPLTRLLQLLRGRVLTLLRPRLWDDPFENFLHQVRLQLPDGTPVGLDRLRNRLYGLCWSLADGSDAAWRIYAPCRDGIRIKSTIGKLLDVIWDGKDPLSPLSSYAGKVTYLPLERILTFLGKEDNALSALTDTSGRAQVSALLFKRQEFAWENEVRLIVRVQEDTGSDTRDFPIDPNDLIERIVLDSRMSDAQRRAARHEIVNVLGYRGNVEDSDLYRPVRPIVMTITR